MNDINAAQRLRVAAADKAEAAKILVSGDGQSSPFARVATNQLRVRSHMHMCGATHKHS